MKVFQSIYQHAQWQTPLTVNEQAQLVMMFGNRDNFYDASFRENLIKHFPNADLVACTTSGEIQEQSIYDESVCLSALTFEKSKVKVVSDIVSNHSDSAQLAQSLAKQLVTDDLSHVLVISDGHEVNGSELTKGLCRVLPTQISVTGGLAGDDVRFSETIVMHNQQVAPGLVVAIGFYGEHVQVGHGYLGGWKPFGSQRIITKSEGNVLHEIDGRPASDLYKEYLGSHADSLPGSALRFPISIKADDSHLPIVRTILAIDDENHTMTFAGDMPEGAKCQLMRANLENLVEGAAQAAESTLESLSGREPEFALIVSCVGRRSVLSQRAEEELEAVQDVFCNAPMAGFYSYGEISPTLNNEACSLHNQTITITAFSEQ